MKRIYLELNEEEAKDLIIYAEQCSAQALVKKIENAVKKQDETIHIIWSYEDIISRAEDAGCKVPSKKKAIEILKEIEHRHDCNLGVTWDTIDFYLESKEWL